ncbi:MAG: BamA/TamA family outer membrane protein [Gemmatimonadaceae bacterium]|nr:BamA/TamA family outer membrane protein [Gemmatimonadaceae bacterium]
MSRLVYAGLRAVRFVMALSLTTGLARGQSSNTADREGRVDSIGRRRIQPLPALASAPETGLQYGATVLAVWEPAARLSTRPSSLLASALRTGKHQTRVRMEAEHWARGNTRRIAGTLQWQEFPLPFYGIGDRSPETAKEIFTPTGTEMTLTLQQRLTGTWYATGGVRHVDQRIVADTSGVLRAGRIPGSAGGMITEWTTGILTDTRDNLFAPRSGHWMQLSYARSVDGAWSDYAYGTVRVDARAYATVATEHVVATQVQLIGIDGVAPFDQLALVGNSDILRGYARGRYRDRWLVAAQSEYRSPIRRRVGGVVFAGAGLSAPAIDALGGRRLLPTYGAGVRVQIDQRQRTGIRVDYGRGRSAASGLYIGFNQAF